MKLSHVLAVGALAGAVVVGGTVAKVQAVDAETTPEKPAVTAKAETPKTDKVETAKGEPLVQDEKPTAEAPKVETSKGEALVPEEKLKELKAEQDKAAAKDKEKTPAKDTAKKPLPKTSAVK